MQYCFSRLILLHLLQKSASLFRIGKRSFVKVDICIHKPCLQYVITRSNSMLPPNRSRALPIVTSIFPCPSLFSFSRSLKLCTPPAYVTGIRIPCPSIAASSSSIPSDFPSTSTAWIRNSSQ